MSGGQLKKWIGKEWDQDKNRTPSLRIKISLKKLNKVDASKELKKWV